MSLPDRLEPERPFIPARAPRLTASIDARLDGPHHRKSWVRNGVSIGKTTVVDNPGGFGAFAPQHSKTSRGAFIGVYRASTWRRAPMGTTYRGNCDYVMQVGNWRAASAHGRRRPESQLNLADFKMMAVQEPPPGKEGNCQFIFFGRAGDIGAPMCKSRAVALVALYATRDLEPGEELFVHYGEDKRRSYCVGLPGRRLNKHEITRSEYPDKWLLTAMHANSDGWRAD